MNEDGMVDIRPVPTEEAPKCRGESRLDMLTADNVEPALRMMLSCLEQMDGRVRLAVRRDGDVLFAGQGLDAWLERSHCLIALGGKLSASGAASQAKIENLLEAGIGEIRTAVLPRSANEGHCIIRSAGLCTDVVAITLQLASESFEPKLADLEAAFGLTPAELHVVDMLQHGFAANEIGERLGISVHTVRAHLRHCYDKLGVSSREELWQRLAPYRLN